jgi:hypothetical protein
VIKECAWSQMGIFSKQSGMVDQASQLAKSIILQKMENTWKLIWLCWQLE